MKNEYTEKEIKKNKAATSGAKVRFALQAVNMFQRQMKARGASLEDRMVFEKEFLEANGLVVPESLFQITKNESSYESLIKFIEERTKLSDETIFGKDFYSAYLIYCSENGFPKVSKQFAFEWLRAKNILVRSGTINGKSYRNVIKGMTLL